MFRFLVIVLLIVVSASLRLADLPWNFAPIGALALFAGAYFKQRWLAISIPVAAMAISDIALGVVNQDVGMYFLNPMQPFIYLCFALYACLGMGLRGIWQKTETTDADSIKLVMSRSGRIADGAVLGSVLFFLLSNFGVWAGGGFYPHTWTGFTQCYIAAIPFFHTTVLSDLIFSAILFGGYALMTSAVPELQESSLVYTD